MSIRKLAHSRCCMGVIEIMIGFMMVSLLLTGLVVAGLYAIRSAKYAQERSIATKIASQQLERFRVKRDSGVLADLGACGGSCNIDNTLNINSGSANEGINTIYTINSAVDMSPPPEECPISSGTVYKITSRVTWGTPLHTVNNEICLSDWR